jgi:integrase
MRKTDWILQFQNSKNWFVRLRDENGRRFVKSLGTSDREQAVILALPMIAEHKAKLLARRPHLDKIWWHQYTPGLHVGPDGGRIYATDRELHHLDASGTPVRTGPNGVPAYHFVGRGPGAKRLFNDLLAGKLERPTVPAKTAADDAIFETYIKHANVTGYFEKEARAVWALYKTLTDNKPLKDATRDDGRKVVQHFEAQKLKSATIKKKVGWLTAAVNLAIGEGKLRFNPFSGVVPKRDDKRTRLPLSDADIAETKRNLGGLDDADQLLFRLLATTGMRLSEAFEIDDEATEHGIRFIIAGKKTEQSLRRVPLPAGMLPHLPKAFKGALFEGGPAAASKRLNRFLRDCGIGDPRKVLHSLRHRAQDRLRAAGCPEDVRWAILGHEEETVAAGYGEGFPVLMLKRWIDKIGF